MTFYLLLVKKFGNIISSSNIVDFNTLFPECTGQYTIGEGATPAAFGEYIKNMDLPQGSTRNPNEGVAP